MQHAREDYQRRFGVDPATDNPELLSEGSTAIGEDEPVCLFRAQDRNFVALLEAYAGILRRDPQVEANIVYSVETHIMRAKQWQNANPGRVKAPDIPRSMSSASDVVSLGGDDATDAGSD